mmetsp:Transcript_12784/g.27749  ORF Transcript_12784/g.27749 Transcript_12784/m.27749 type:complete len:280 (-) Transcript_12784:149-988(-)
MLCKWLLFMALVFSVAVVDSFQKAPPLAKTENFRRRRGGSDNNNEDEATAMIRFDTSQRASAAAIGQYAPAAASLFSNMITPASILGGAIIPMSFASGLAFSGDEDESKFAKFLRKTFPLVSVSSLASLLISVLWSSVIVNQLTENEPALAASVWDLLCRDYALPWAAVNSHFVLGMLGYMWLIGTKAYFMSGQQLSIFTLAMSAMIMMVSIVNRGIASGGGNEAYRYGKSIVGLISSYLSMLFQRIRSTFGPLECIAVVLFIGSFGSYAKYVWNQIES